MGAWPVISLIVNITVNITNSSREIIPAGKDFQLNCDGRGLSWTYTVNATDRVTKEDKGNFTILQVKNATINDTGLYKCYNFVEPDLFAAIYLYVFDNKHLLLPGQNYSNLEKTDIPVPCRATHPDVNVTLTTRDNKHYPHTHSYNPQSGFVIQHSNDPMDRFVACRARYKNITQTVYYALPNGVTLDPPEINGKRIHRVQEGHNITLSCLMERPRERDYELRWNLPSSKVPNKTKGVTSSNGCIPDINNCFDIYNNVTISFVKKNDGGKYHCDFIGTFIKQSDIVEVIVYGSNESYISIDLKNKTQVNHTLRDVHIIAQYEGIPKPIFVWLDPNGNIIKNSKKYDITVDETTVRLIINYVTTSDAGVYVLQGQANHLKQQKSITLFIKSPPIVTLEGNQNHFIYSEMYKFKCKVYAHPVADVVWLFQNCSNSSHCYESIIEEKKNLSKQNDTSEITLQALTSGKITCKVHNLYGSRSDSISLNVTEPSTPKKSPMVAAVSAILVLLLVAVICLVLKIVFDKKRLNTITVQDVAAFHEGSLIRINPDLEIDEQVNLLPYNKYFEFPRDKLKLGKQLGNGAFGIVVKAEAEGLKENELFTTVAVKMVKSHADISHLKALMTELKILMYIGHHLNVLNLLGACTVNLLQKELLVIVEYCRFGNLHSYMQRHRETFINQILPNTSIIDFSLGNDQLKTDENISMNPNPAGETLLFRNSFGTTQSMSCTGETIASNIEDSCDSSCSNHIMNKWSIAYKNDAGNMIGDPLTTKDLLSWSFQVAMGMDYLSNRKIVHADLATRNILLADNNIVKISDFGLARPLYEKMDYRKKGQDPLPIKWMAIESIEYRVFSSKSDVWSFGVVLWEIFSLGKSPYPGMEVNETFLEKLSSGYRMPKPEFCTEDIYSVMQECWMTKPIDRPKFSYLADRIGKVLDTDTKQRYVELGTPYIIQNSASKNYDDYLNSIKDDQSEYVAAEFPEHTYINTNDVCVEELEMRNIDSSCDYKNVTLSATSDYLIMSGHSES